MPQHPVALLRELVSKKPKSEFKPQDESLISQLADDGRWIAVKKAIDLKIEYLRNLLNPFSGQFIIENDTPEMVGFKFLIVSAVIDFLTEVRDLPDTFRKVIEEENERGKGSE